MHLLFVLTSSHFFHSGLFIIVFMVDLASIPIEAAQIICCFVPPLALQLGARSFLKSYTGLPLSGICGIMVRVIRSFLE